MLMVLGEHGPHPKIVQSIISIISVRRLHLRAPGDKHKTEETAVVINTEGGCKTTQIPNIWIKKQHQSHWIININIVA